MGGFGEVPELATARITVAGDDINGLQLAVGKAGTVTGRVLVPPGTQSFQPSTMRVVTGPADPDQMMMPAGGGGKINDDLTFELKVPPGRALIRLLARTAGEWVTKAQRVDGVDIMERGIEGNTGEKSGEL